MVASRPTLLALAAAFTFASQVQAASSPTLSLSSCVTACIETESCETSDVKCVCKGARSKLLYNVAVCMYYRCPDEMSSFAESFIAPVESACKAIDRDIPQSKINLAEATARLLADKVPKTSSKVVATPTTPKTSATTSPVKQTTTTTPKAQPTTTTETEESTTSSEDDEPTTTKNSPTTTSPSKDTPTTAPTTLATATNSPSRAATQSTTSTTSTRAAGRPDPTDSSPFATTPNAAGRSRGIVLSWLLASLPIALVMAMR